MQEILEKRFFPFVEKPGRYLGNELGAVEKDPDGRLNIALAYPDLYEVGMSYVGGQLLYHLFNKNDDTLCERVYAPAIDAEKIMRAENIPLFSLESHRPIRQFDLLGFTLSYEMVYTNLLNMLDLAEIPILATDRTDDDPLIAAGGPICFNPQPMADFIDFFFVGEIEDSLEELLEALKWGRGKSRRERLLRLARVQSVYVPRFYDPDRLHPMIDDLPERIKAGHTKKLMPENYPGQPLVPNTEITHDRISIEIMRGCPQGCRFCQAGKIYKPVRIRSVSDIKQQLIENLKATGYDEVSLLSLSTADYPDIDRLTSTLAEPLSKYNASISLPSLRPASFTRSLAQAAIKGHRSGLTFAPEVGSDRMRQVIGKDITEEELLTAARIAFEKGWNLIKLYFMIGLPTETTDDVKAIADLIMKTVRVGRKIKGQHKINVTISPFSPKPHTPFQWDRVCTPAEVEQKYDILKQNLHAREVTLKFRNPKVSFLEAIIGRGDRSLGKVIHTAYKKGARFDGWREHFDYEIWNSSFEEHELSLNDLAADISFTNPLPWDIIDRGQSKERLQKERSQTSLAAYADKPAETPVKPEPSGDDPDMFGRQKKRVSADRSANSPTRGKIRLKWGKSGSARFLSHLDNNRVFERAIRRAGIPVAYSQGFHPHPKLSFGPPLPLGYSSESEFLDIQIDAVCSRKQIDELGQNLPKGYFVIDEKTIYSKAPAISSVLNRAVYKVYGDWKDESFLEDRINEIMLKESILATRSTKTGGKEVDIRPAIYRLELHKDQLGSILEMELGLGESGYAKPSEVVESLGVIDSAQIVSLHFHRRSLQYRDKTGESIDPLKVIV